MELLNCSTDNTPTSFLSDESMQNALKHTTKDTDLSINEGKEVSTEMRNDLKNSSTSENQTDQRNCVSAGEKDRNSTEKITAQDDVKSDVHADESENEVKEQKDGRRKRKSTR